MHTSQLPCLLSIAVWLALSSTPTAGELPDAADLADLSAHLAEVPPSAFDVEVLSEHTRNRLTPKHARMFAEEELGEVAQSFPRDTDELEEYLKQAAERIALENRVTYQSRERFRFSAALGYRHDYVLQQMEGEIESDRLALAALPFTHSTINPGNDPDDLRYVELDHQERMAALYKQAGGKRLVREVWGGGTFDGQLATTLRRLLRVGQPEHQSHCSKLLSGNHPFVQMEVTHGALLPDGSNGRHFDLLIREGTRQTSVSFDVPAQSFQPVWKLTRDGQTIMEVLEASGGTATLWRDTSPQAPVGGRLYQLLARQLNSPLNPADFAFAAPAGYISADYTAADSIKLTYPDGRVEIQSKAPSGAKSPANRPSMWYLAGIYALLIPAVIASLWFWRARGKPAI